MLIAAALGAFSLSPARAEPQRTDGISVSPAAALFDVQLHPGETEYRLATVTNATPDTAAISLTISQQRWEGHPENEHHILVATAPTLGTCDASTFTDAPSMAMADMQSIGHGTVPANSSQSFCVAASLPADTALPGNARSTVHFVFNAVHLTGDLATTGFDAQPGLIIAAGFIVVAGVLLVTRRRRPDNSAS